MIYVAVATLNQAKIGAVEQVFQRYFKEVEVKGCSVPSGVQDQPCNQEVMQGALNRLESLKKVSEADFFVAIEGGLICQGGKWFNQQIVLVEAQDGKQSWGLSPSYPIPEKYIKEAKATSVADVLDRIFEGKGGIRVLTQGAMTRENLIEDAVIMALTGVLNGDLW